MTDNLNEVDPHLRDEFYVESKDPDYIYRWCNERDRNMRVRMRQGYRPVEGTDELPPEFRQSTAGAGAQSTGNPSGGTTIRRGDLILCRIPKAAHEKNIAGPRRREMERHRGSVEDMVASANERARREMTQAGYTGASIPAQMVFQDSPEPFKS